MTFLLATSHCACLSFLTTSCNHSNPSPTPPPKPVKDVTITEPEEKTTEVNLDQQGATQVIFYDFHFDGIEDGSKLTVNGTFEHKQSKFEYSIINFDLDMQSFGISINITNATAIDHLKGKFSFTYDNVPITQEQPSDFDISLLSYKEIVLPTTKEYTSQIVSGKARAIFVGFSSIGIDNPEPLEVVFSGQPTLGQIKSCIISNFHDNTFDVIIEFDGVAAEDVVGHFSFFYKRSTIDVPQDDFTCTLLRDHSKPDFTQDSWLNIMQYANDGLSCLQEHYGIASFVGLTHNIGIYSDKELTFCQYQVRVIGQNHDCYETGTKVALTFQFESVVSDDDFNPITKEWGTEDDYAWCDPETDSECVIREYLRKTFSARIEPDALHNFKPVMKKTYCDDKNAQTIESKDKIWCLSPSEMGLIPDGKKIFDEGDCYEYYLDCYGKEADDKRTCTKYNSTEKVDWWCRSVFTTCTTTGSITHTTGHILSMRPCFCI